MRDAVADEQALRVLLRAQILGGAVDVTMRAVASAASAIGTLIGLEPPSRPLTDEEKAWFREVYGDTLDLDVIRVKQGGLVTLGASKCVGNTVYLADDCFDSNGNLNNRGINTLAHEVAHVWQNQNGGGDYIHKALASQAWAAITGGSRNGAYNWREGMNEGLHFTELNPEQQATLVEEITMAMRNGTFLEKNYSAKEWAYMQAGLVNVRAGNVG